MSELAITTISNMYSIMSKKPKTVGLEPLNIHHFIPSNLHLVMARCFIKY